MMMPSSSSYSSSSSSGSATVRVEKATSEFLIGPDWTINIDICDTINSNNWLAKDVVKALKKRLQHKNPNVHLLALTLLETMVKNCGDYVHSQIVERNILQDMIKIVKKKTDMRVREKILVLLDSWQEAFGGARGKYPQYYWAYEELRRSGVEFPHRTSDSALIFTPAVTHPMVGHAQAGYGMPINSSTRLDEAMASEVETLSLSSISSMREVLDLLSAMLQAVNSNDRMAVKDEVIVDLVGRCRSNQKKLMQMLTTTGDEELLGQGLELNDSIQNELAKHDAVASGSPLPTQVMNFEPPLTNIPDSSPKATEDSGLSSGPSVVPSAPPSVVETRHPTEEEEEEDDFAQLARRHSKTRSSTSQSTSVGTSETADSLGNALALPDPPAPVKTTKDQDMIDLLSLTLSTTATSPQASSSQNVDHPYTSQSYPGNQGQVVFNGYVAPWAQAQARPLPQQPQPQPQPQPQLQPQPPYQPQLQSQSPYQPQVQPQQPHLQAQSQYPQFSSGYPPPPWAATPGYYSNQNNLSTYPYAYLTSQANNTTPQRPFQGARPLQQVNFTPAIGSNGSVTNGDAQMSSTPRGNAPAAGQKPFVPSYRLFEDLNVLGNGDGRFSTKNTSPSLSGTSTQSMVGGRK